MADQSMLKFVTVERDMPKKRSAEDRNRDFGEIYAEFARRSKPADAASAACRIAKRIVRCTTTSPIGCG